MSVRNLDHLFKPESVALIGASTEPGSIGAVIAKNLLRAGFEGPVLPVHPRHRSVEGVLAYPDVASLPVVPDLAVIATPPQTVAPLVAELGARGTRAVVIISAGFGRGSAAEQAILDAARPHLLRVVGPNTVGVLSPNRGLNASFAHLSPDPGHLAFVTQSGAVVTAVIDWAKPRGIGFSHLVSLGDMSDVDFGDLLDYLASDGDTRAILLYVEGIRHARKFMSAARAAARMKPVIVVKGGRQPEGAQAAASHTGSMAGADDVYEAAFQRAGMLRVGSLEELFTATETLADVRLPKGDRLAIVTNGGGMGVLAADELAALGGRLATLPETTLAELDRVLPASWSRGNPVDIIGDAPPERFADAVRVLVEHHRDMDALLVLNCPTAVAAPADCARALTGVVRPDRAPVPVLTSWVGESTAAAGRDVLNAGGFASYETPGLAVRAFMQLVDYVRNQDLLMETPPSVPEAFEPDLTGVRTAIDRRLEGGEGGWLSEADVQRVLTAYGIEVVGSRTAGTPEAAGRIAEELGVAVALKILSPDVTHKSDVGGVVLDLAGGAAVTDAARLMLERIRAAVPAARIDGFTVQPMVIRPGAHELIVGMHEDAQFGPVLLFGHGGTAVEVINDRALGLPPLNLKLARDMMRRTRIHRLLEGYRDRPAADLDAIAMTLLRVSQLVVDVPEIRTLDINPLLADENGVLALDARIHVERTGTGDGAARLAIRPYPKALESTVTTKDGQTLLLRPIVPEDEPALHAGFARLTPEEIRLRFLAPVGMLTHMLAARFTQLDYDRDMALVLTGPGVPGRAEIWAVVRISADPDNEQAEFAIIVRHEMSRQGLGSTLMQRIIDYARSRGIREVWGVTLRENAVMRALARSLGFTESIFTEDPTLVRLSLRLAAAGAPAAPER
ncbi:MAG: GNAT family N-acetyltransferase [Pseudomonadales bacterium]